MAKKSRDEQGALFSNKERNIHAIEGVVDRVFFSNERFSAGTLETKTHGSIRIRGNLPLLSPGMKLKGKWSRENDPKWGEQYEAITVYVSEEVDELGGLEAFLRQKIKGVGPKAAANIIQKFGDKTLDALTDPERLAEVKGIGPALAKAIPDMWEEVSDEYMHLRNMFSLGLPYYQAKLAIDHFGANAHAILTGNIYKLTDVTGIGFKFADKIALDSGMEPLDPRRLAAVAVFAMTEALRDGHTIVDERTLLGYVDDKTELSHEDALEGLRLALESGDVTHSYRGHYALTYVAEAEMEVMKRLSKLATSKGSVKLEPKDEFLTDEQREIFNILGRNRLAVLTGGPGVGKGLPMDAKVLTPRGWKRNSDLRIGDCLIGRDGKPTRVTGIYPQEKRPTFLVEFGDGASVICDDQHLWLTRSYRERRNGEPGSVKTTLEIMDSINYSGRLNHSIDYVEPVRFAHPGPRCAEPYALGELLARSAVGPKEREILHSVGISNTALVHRYIPKEYLYAPLEERIALLQGLLDSKAAFVMTGVLRWSCASSRLSRDFMELVRGLGGRATVDVTRPTPEGDVYSHGFAFPEDSIVEPFRHSEIKDKYKPAKLPFHRYIVSVTPMGEERTQCLSVDAPDELFVIKDYVVTHNTRTVSALVDAAKAAGVRFSLAAPTGKAARRISELSGEEASTIHRLLAWQPPGGFTFDASNPLPDKLVVVDESSMIDVFLMRSLLRAIGPETTLLLVGDADQLPPVGPGQPFAHTHANLVRLTRIFRQAQENPIIMAAHSINNQRQPHFPTGDKRLGFESYADTEELITNLLARYDELAEAHGEPPQVLSPMNVGPIGVKALNERLKAHVNPGVGEPFHLAGNQAVHKGDIVIQTKNDYEVGLMNGEQGTVLAYNAEEITLRTSLGDIILSKNQAKTLQLAYAITIHRSQGSQWKSCILLCHMSHFIMLSKELMYTGLTRASEAALFIGEKRALAMSLRKRMSERKSIMAFPEAWEDISGS